MNLKQLISIMYNFFDLKLPKLIVRRQDLATSYYYRSPPSDLCHHLPTTLLSGTHQVLTEEEAAFAKF